MILSLKVETTEELRALYEALGQYCDNQKDFIAGEDNPIAEALSHLDHAEKYLNKFDSLFGGLSRII